MDFQNRKLPRLSGYDYSSPGTYFVTICTFEKRCILGSVISGAIAGDAYIRYSPVGEIAKNCLLETESHYPNIKIDNWVIMPNHIHILFRIDGGMEQIYPFPTSSISTAIGTFKAAVTRAAGNAHIHSGKLWQKSFYDHIIRNESDYQNIWQYICGNPSRWLDDCFYVAE